MITLRFELPILNIELKFRFNRINSDYCPGKNLGILVAGDSDNGVESLVASSSGQHVYTGTLGGQVSLWDVSSQVAKWQLAVSSGPVTKLVLGEGEDVLYCATEDGGLRAVDTRTGAAVGEWR